MQAVILHGLEHDLDGCKAAWLRCPTGHPESQLAGIRLGAPSGRLKGCGLGMPVRASHPWILGFIHSLGAASRVREVPQRHGAGIDCDDPGKSRHGLRLQLIVDRLPADDELGSRMGSTGGGRGGVRGAPGVGGRGPGGDVGEVAACCPTSCLE